MRTDTPSNFLAALGVEKANMNTYLTQLGFSSAELDECSDDLANLEVALGNVPIATEGKQSVIEVKDQVYNGKAGEPLNPYPSFDLTPLPNPSVKGGALPRYNNRKQRAKLAPGYTTQIGIAMGYEDEPAAAIPPGSVKPVIESVSASATGHSFGILISNRADATSADVLIRRSGSETLTKIDTFTGKAGNITVPLTTPGQPEKIQVVIQLKRKNENYGQQSDAVSVTLNP
jgi:hypothetical protein